MNANAKFFETFEPQTVEIRCVDQLQAGQYLMTIEKVVFETDKIEDSTSIVRDWRDENEVMYVYLTSPEGVFHHRMYAWGYWKYTDILLDPGHRNELSYIRRSVNPAREYAIDTRTECRIVSDRNTKYAQRMINEFITAAGGGQACKISELEGKKLWIELVPERIAGKVRMKLLQVSPEGTGFKHKPAPTSGFGTVPSVLFDLPEWGESKKEEPKA
jgi:hypothetical protein